MSLPQVRHERTGWRDLSLSQRHRLWGWDCPAVDLDLLMVEYDRGRPKGLVEYKHENAACPDWNSPSIKAAAHLASSGAIPFFVVRYAGDFAWFDVWPCNAEGHRWVPGDNSGEISEVEYVSLLYRIRGRLLPTALRAALEEPLAVTA